MDNIDVMISEDEICARVREIAGILNKDYKDTPVKLIVVLKGSVFFACELAKRLTMPVTMDFMVVSSYGDGMVSAGKIVVKKELEEDIKDEHVIIVEDIIDSGNTLYHLKKLLLARNPKSLKIVTLLDKKECRTAEIEADYTCFVIPDKFVVGYGLDYAQKYRNLSYIGVINNEG